MLSTMWNTRKHQPPSFSAFKPRDYRFTGQARSMSHVAWSCDGKRIAAVGLDKMARVWNADKQVRVCVLECSLPPDHSHAPFPLDTRSIPPFASMTYQILT